MAVGLTPEMLPMIVTVCLSQGAIGMSRKKVIVKRLNSIQNLGAMDVLCTDKTGTLTMDHVILERHCDVVQHENDEVLLFAYLNSHFQTGLKNVLDRAILQHREMHDTFKVPEFQKVDEIPFDFSRRVMSVVVKTPEGRHRLICKGPGGDFQRCNRFELDGKIYPIDPLLIQDLQEEHDSLSADGFRVLALAYDESDASRTVYSRNNERDLILKGYVAFLDPPKETAAPAIAALKQHGISVKILTGDNELVSRKICRRGRSAHRAHTGGLAGGRHVGRGAGRGGRTGDALFAALAGRQGTHRAGPADPTSTSSVSWATASTIRPPCGPPTWASPSTRAVDIAKEAADVILLEKSLMVLEEGVLEGRKVFANILKYIRMGASSNFGNMFSVLGGQRLAAVSAHEQHPDSGEQSALRLLPGADPRQQRRSRSRSPSRVPGTWARSPASSSSSGRAARSSTTPPTCSCTTTTTAPTSTWFRPRSCWGDSSTPRTRRTPTRPRCSTPAGWSSRC